MSLSALLGIEKPASQIPVLTFHGPDAHGRVRVTNPSGQELALLIASNDSITRQTNTTPIQICTYKRSSLSGTTTLYLHGQEVKVRQSWEGLRYGKDIEARIGKFKWRAGSGGYEELRDSRKILLARGKMPGTVTKREGRLEVFVDGDAGLVDLIMASWVTTIKGQKEEDEVVGEVVSALVGA